MTLHYLSESAEKALRIEYVNSEGFDYRNYNGYREYVMNTIPGVIEALYKGGGDCNWMEALLFDTDEHLAWFMLRWE